MFYKELTKLSIVKFIFSVIFFAIVFLLSFSVNYVYAKDGYLVLSEDSELNNEIAEEQYSESDYDNVFNYNDSEHKQFVERKPSLSRSKRNQLMFNEQAFFNKPRITLGGLILRISGIVALLIGCLLLVKFYFNKNNLSLNGNLWGELTQKLSNNFSSLASNLVKLKQTLILTPGQNIYLVEIEGKKLLLGGTHQGGVQFLADLSDKMASTEGLGFRQLEDSQNNAFARNVSYEIKNDFNKPYKHMDIFSTPLPENPYLTSSVQQEPDAIVPVKPPTEQLITQKPETKSSTSKLSFRRRTNFRQTLLSESAANQEDISRIR